MIQGMGPGTAGSAGAPWRAAAGLAGSSEYLERLITYRRDRRAARRQQAREKGEQVALPTFGERFNGDILREVQLRARQQCATTSPVHERLVMFWSNHFTVSAEKQSVRLLAGAFEREAIRPHIGDDFATLLLGAEQHPAMLMYLDNAGSIGRGRAWADGATSVQKRGVASQSVSMKTWHAKHGASWPRRGWRISPAGCSGAGTRIDGVAYPPPGSG